MKTDFVLGVFWTGKVCFARFVKCFPDVVVVLLCMFFRKTIGQTGENRHAFSSVYLFLSLDSERRNKEAIDKHRSGACFFVANFHQDSR